MHKHATLGECGGMLPVEITCSEIASEAIWDKSRAVVAVWLHPIFSCPYAFAKPGDVQFPREKVLYSWQNRIACWR